MLRVLPVFVAIIFVSFLATLACLRTGSRQPAGITATDYTD
ncbi:MAG TPA: hypothetical protein VI731_10275 [Bacteroidia bacterium]|nr:hypothetical protein [Bacteroidia bacterium]